jgi:hypothetical protein
VRSGEQTSIGWIGHYYVFTSHLFLKYLFHWWILNELSSENLINMNKNRWLNCMIGFTWICFPHRRLIMIFELSVLWNMTGWSRHIHNIYQRFWGFSEIPKGQASSWYAHEIFAFKIVLCSIDFTFYRQCVCLSYPSACSSEIVREQLA